MAGVGPVEGVAPGLVRVEETPAGEALETRSVVDIVDLTSYHCYLHLSLHSSSTLRDLFFSDFF